MDFGGLQRAAAAPPVDPKTLVRTVAQSAGWQCLESDESWQVVVPVGSLDPDAIHLPGIYVKRMILGSPYDKKIEFRTVREREAA